MFLLALVAVGAPVWANAYVCPMEQAAIAERAAVAKQSGCCPKVQTQTRQATSATRFETPCDCAQLQWDVADVDAPRSVVFDVATTLWTRTGDALLSGRLNPVLRLRVVANPPVALCSPPLWVRNQSIRC